MPGWQEQEALKMISLNFLTDYSPLLILLVSFILIYAALTKLKVPGNNPTLAFLSLLLSLIFVASAPAVKYAFNLIPYLAVILVISMVVMIMLGLTGKIEDYMKKVAMIGFILAIVIIIGLAFNQFTVLNHMLPNTSDSGLDSSLADFKGWLYSSQVIETIVFVGCIALVWFYLLKKVGK
jgi:ethanolamine transporter EutH